jgi:hypothetical protein
MPGDADFAFHAREVIGLCFPARVFHTGPEAVEIIRDDGAVLR